MQRIVIQALWRKTWISLRCIQATGIFSGRAVEDFWRVNGQPDVHFTQRLT